MTRRLPVFAQFCTVTVLLLAAISGARAQSGGVGIGTAAPDASAALDVSSTTKGLLLPRLSLVQRQAMGTGSVAAPVAGLVIYQTDNTPGLYAYDGTGWVRLAADDLGNHTATQNLSLGTNKLVGNGGSAGLAVSSTGSVGIGTSTPRGKLDVDGGDSYLVDDPNAGSGQSVFLPGHLFLAPYTGSSGTAFVQARVPNPTSSTALGLTLRTTSSGAVVDAVAVTPAGRVGIGTNAPDSPLEVGGVAGDIHAGGAVLARALVSTAYQSVEGPGPGATNQYHTAQCTSGWGIASGSAVITDYGTGGLLVNCANLTYLLGTTGTWRNGPDYLADDQFHSVNCNSNEIATGLRFYATSYWDGGPDLYCQPVAPGVTRGNSFASSHRNVIANQAFVTVPFGCPPGTYLTGLTAYARSFIGSYIGPQCATLTK